MFNFIPPYLLYIISFALSAVISMYAVRKILFITRSRKIYDLPDDTRKIHGAEIPSLGGIGIFTGFLMVSSFLWLGHPLCIYTFLPSAILLFFTGIYDDLMNMKASKKLVAQLIASAIVVYFSNIRITSLHGIMGIETLPYIVSFTLSTLGCTLFINAFNFIDGIDGLAGIIAVLYSCILGMLFAVFHFEGNAIVAFSLAGATLGLLVFNVAPAKIYMGDTGSMMLGFTVFILSLIFLEDVKKSGKFANDEPFRQAVSLIHSEKGSLIIIISVLFLPVYDALRVFALRLYKGKSPLKADRTHLHYYLIDAGFGHTASVAIIVITNMLIIASAFLTQDLNPLVSLLCAVSLASVALFIIYALRRKNMGANNKVVLDAK